MIGQRLKELREKAGMNKKEFAKYLGLKYTTYNNYETEAREPASDFLILISDKFDVSIDYLLGRKEEYTVFHSYQIKSSEYKIVEKYRTLDDYGKETVKIILDRESDRTQQISAQSKELARLRASPAAIIEMQNCKDSSNRIVEYFRSASAGDGVFILGNEVTDTIALPDTPETRNADYVIKVSGASMEPDYHDGDNVLVSQKMEMHYGDVGIFIVDGKAYIKEYGETELISRNPDAENITISEYDNIVCMGKVIGKLEKQFEAVGKQAKLPLSKTNIILTRRKKVLNCQMTTFH